MLKRIFSIKNTGKIYKTVTFLGVKIRFLHKRKVEKWLDDLDARLIETEREIDRKGIGHLERIFDFVSAAMKPKHDKTILIIEPNNCHGEVMPGFAKYLLDAGFRVDVLIAKEMAGENPFCRFHDERIRIFSLDIMDIWRISRSSLISSYKMVLFTSCKTYLLPPERCSIFEISPSLRYLADKLLVVEHHGSLIDSYFPRKRIISIADFGLGTSVVNPHYFGEIKTTVKSKDITRFIVVGAMEPERRNCQLLISAVQSLLDSGITDFSVTVIGRGKIGDLPASVGKHIDIRGVLSFEKMYLAMEEGDYFLPLLDPDNPEHDRYLNESTSGSIQLIYGFRKPCLVHKKFAGKYGFQSANSLIYSQNDELADAMKKAIALDADQYESLQRELATLANAVFSQSAATMESLLKTAAE